VDIIHRFRRFAIAFTADIAKMYWQILFHPDDCKFQYILWRNSINEEIQIYRLNTVTYGTVCAPYLAIKCLRTLAEDFKAKFPVGAAVASQDFYVDDCMHSVPTLEEAIQTREELQSLCNSGGFPLQKWPSYSKKLLEQIPETLLENSPLLDIVTDPSVKTLGIRWNTIQDCFQFKYQTFEHDANTKRSILSCIAKLYDPMG